jgi:ferrochelatase
MTHRAVLLVNLGSPESPTEKDVRIYLREFLGDERVIDMPDALRWLLLEGIVLRTRPKKSAHAYVSIWTPEGSPLMVTSEKVRTKLAAALGPETPVYLAMRYGQPSIRNVIARMVDDGVREILLFPQYPHFAMSSWETVVVRVEEEVARQRTNLRMTCVQPFYSDEDYIAALHVVAAPYLAKPHDHLLFSYHGIPLRHVRKAGCLCGKKAEVVDQCCARESASYDRCYRAQVLATTRGLVARAGIDAKRHSVSFQSRLAGEPWLRPFTDHELKRLPASGVKRLLVICPAFVTDCLETLEEISVAGKETFLAAGGTSFQQIPCLNDHAAYIAFLAGRVERWRADRGGVECPPVAQRERADPLAERVSASI